MNPYHALIGLAIVVLLLAIALAVINQSRKDWRLRALTIAEELGAAQRKTLPYVERDPLSYDLGEENGRYTFMEDTLGCFTALHVGDHHEAVYVVTRTEDGDETRYGQQIVAAIMRAGAPLPTKHL